MSLLGLLFKPNSRLPSCTISAAVTPRSTPKCSRQPQHIQHRRICHPDDTRRKGGKARREVELRTVEDVFIGGLVAAGTCQQHRKSLGEGDWRPRTKGSKGIPESQRSQSRLISISSLPRSKKDAKPTAGPHISPKEYNELVDIYPGFEKGTPPPANEPPDASKKREHYPLASSLVLTPSQEHKSRPKRRQIRAAEFTRHRVQLLRFIAMVQQKPGYVPHSRLWAAYEALPEPRIPYLKDETIYRAFRHLIWVEYKDAEGGEAMRRFLALLKDCVVENVWLNDMIWNSAIAFSGRWMRKVTGDEVKAAVEMWMQMEGAGQAATNVTFNILFDLAVRSGRYALADTIFSELRARKMPLNRYFRTSVIFYAGMKRDGDGVRKAFRELVNAGEIVDTAVMNCVILSLLRAGEAPAAETVFARMNRLHAEKFGTAAPTDWRDMKELGGLLSETGEKLRREESQHEMSFFGGKYSFAKKREELQQAAPIAPNANTYRILIKYHAYTSGDLPKIHELLAGMKERGFNVHGSVYVHVLRGFATHGGFAFSAWSRVNLENLWAEIAGVVGIKVLEPKVGEMEPEELVVDEIIPEGTYSWSDVEDFPAEVNLPDPHYQSETTYRPFGTHAEDGIVAPDSTSSPQPSEDHRPSSLSGVEPMHITDYDFSKTGISPHATYAPTKVRGPLSSLDVQSGTESLPDTETSSPETSPSPAPRSPSDPSLSSLSSTRETPFDTTPELDRPTYMTSSFAIAALDAFYKVTGCKRMLHVWTEIQASWHGASAEELERVRSKVERYVEEDKKYVSWEKTGWRRDERGPSTARR